MTSGSVTRIILFPIDNQTGTRYREEALLEAIRAELTRRGVEVVPQREADAFMAKYRVRYTAGVETRVGPPAAAELGVDGIVIPTLMRYTQAPSISLTLRLVSSGNMPSILWMDSFSAAGDDAAGFLGLGMITSLERLQARALESLGASLRAALDGRGPRALPCPENRKFAPKHQFRSPRVDDRDTYTIAVMPFLNHTKRRGAGDAVSLEFVHQLAASPGFRVIEPGAVREALIANRVVLENGVSLEHARIMVGYLEADLVLGGEVREYEDAPKAEFTISLFDRRTNEVIYESRSFNSGTDSQHAFRTGRVSTVSALTCRMARMVVQRMAPAQRRAPPAAAQQGAAVGWSDAKVAAVCAR